jgi:outer membrane immunogenic protein
MDVHMRPTSLLVLSAVAAVVGSNALAGPFDDMALRGSHTPAYYDRPAVQPRFVPGKPVRRRWDGFYIGGQVGYANSGINFSKGVEDLIANLLRDTTVEAEFRPSDWANLPGQSVTRPSFGGFFGYNTQFEDVIFGVEANYNRTNIKMAAGDTIARVVNTSDGYANTVVLTGTGSIHLTDYGTLRARAGWVYDRYIPYAFIGAAVARATISRSASLTMDGVDADPGCVGPPNVCLPPYSFAASQSEIKQGAFAWGWTLGAGIDWVLFSNLFLRGEYEYIGFAEFYGANLHIHTVRTAIGFKF